MHNLKKHLIGQFGALLVHNEFALTVCKIYERSTGSVLGITSQSCNVTLI